MLKRLLKIFAFISLPFFIFYLLFFIYARTEVVPKEPMIQIEKGMTLRAIGARLESQGIIQHRWLFLAYTQLTGGGKNLKAGEYFFEKAVSPREVLDYLVHGKIYAYRMQIIEGWTLRQIAEAVPATALAQHPNFKEEFLKQATDGKLEGILFPNTYYLSPDAAPSDYLKIFTKEFEKNYQKASADLKTPPLFTKHQIVTLASLIEKETGDEKERTIIASVFYNRLAKGMPLQSDPTVIYGLKNFNGDITKADLSNPHPYNTYVHAGLPPGPICNPGLASLKAALHPAQTDLLFFVSEGNGTHYFSKTASEHAEAVRKFQLGETRE